MYHLSKGEILLNMNTSKLRIFALQRKFERTLWPWGISRKKKMKNNKTMLSRIWESFTSLGNIDCIPSYNKKVT